MLDKKTLLLKAINAAILAGVKVEELYENGFKVETKPDNSPVTEADLAADAEIRRVLADTELPIMSEEVAQGNFADRKGMTDYWCVDPIDGTRGFVARSGEFCICIALIVDRKAFMGVIYQPIERKMYFGMVGSGAFKAECTGVAVESVADLSAVSMPSRTLPKRFTMLTTSYHANKRTRDYIAQVLEDKPKAQVLRVGSALKFCLMADGQAHHYPRFGKMNDWDIAAGQAILEAAGGRLVPMEAGKELLYNSEHLNLEDFFCWLE